MSIFHAAKAKCPKCGTEIQAQLVASVNADRRPDLRVAILDGTFQSEQCPKCDTQIRLAPHLTFLNLERGQWILVQPPEAIGEWQTAETEASLLYDDSFGANAPEAAAGMGDGVAPRVVFGWPALREKLVCADLSLIDTTLELLKIAVLRSVPDAPLADETELRLTGGDAETLHFTWIETTTEGKLDSLNVPRAAFDAIAGDDASWALLRANFDGKLFVDVKRMLLT